MIESLKLVNFQTHKKSLFEFSPGINVITGKSDEGKSSVIRALYWLLFNKPSGNEFINWNAKKCIVTSVINGHEIVREKSNGGTNKYIVDGDDFNATRTDVPEQVTELTKITHTNIQMQDDPYFMLSLNSGDVGRKLNEVVGLNQIDKSIKYVNGVYRKSFNRHNHIKEDVTELESKLSKYTTLDSIEQLNSKYTSIENNLDQIEGILDIMRELIDDLEELIDLKDESEKLNTLSNDIGEYLDKDNSIEDTDKTIQRIKNIISSIENDASTIDTLSKFHKEIETYLSDYLSQEDQHTKLHDNVLHIQELMTTMDAAAQEVSEIESTVNEVENEFHKFKQSIKECPLCERPFL